MCEDKKRSPGRPAGREYTSRLDIMLKPETRKRLDKRAKDLRIPISKYVRDLLEADWG